MPFNPVGLYKVYHSTIILSKMPGFVHFEVVQKIGSPGIYVKKGKICFALGMSIEELYPLQGFKITRIIKNTSNKVLIEATSTNWSTICP
jgi:hypothetical protein